ncbi:cell division protein FtsK [bacterium]|nr:cell division protein FtsK [bacterium]
MSGRRRKKRSTRDEAWWSAPWVAGLFLVVLAIYLGLSLTADTAPWWLWLDGGELESPLSFRNPGGPVGAVLAWSLGLGLGVVWVWTAPVLLLVVGMAAVVGRSGFVVPLLWRAGVLWLVSVALLGQPGWPWGELESIRLAGFVGSVLGRAAHALVGVWGTRLFLGLALTLALIWIARPVLAPAWTATVPVIGRALNAVAGALSDATGALIAGVRRWPDRLRSWRASSGQTPSATRRPLAPEPPPDPDDEPMTPAERSRSIHWPEEPIAGSEPDRGEPEPAAEGPDDDLDVAPSPVPAGPLELPSIDLLTEPAGDEPELSPIELDEAADLLEETLRSFGVQGEVKDVRPGPVVTTYEYQPASGIRVSQIVQRADDLALAMRARSLRMEAPIPGEAAVGIEIPNQQPQLVSLREVLGSESSQGRPPLQVTLGKDVQGRSVSIDLAAQPHLLVAGSTGSGKSVCLNAMITNLLLYNDPARLRFLMIDPKMLELNVYNGVPHLLMPVITDPKEALRAMNWMVAQMDQRYRQLSRHAVRNIEQYNAKVARGEVPGPDGEPLTDPMPYYVTIVDELADLMVQLGQDFEVPVTRLAQKARAVGMHLVLATQRPSVDVLTGVIKANIPCRIAFRVIQKNDSRTILDQNGAEQLLGKGDMLYLMPGRAQPIRVHGAFVDVPECEAVADHWRQYTGTTDEVRLDAGGDGGLGVHTGEDDLFEEAVRVVVTHESGSTSLLQRRLRIGYTRAGRLMDMMEEAGIVGPFTGSKARDVLVKPADLPDLFGDEDPTD